MRNRRTLKAVAKNRQNPKTQESEQEQELVQPPKAPQGISGSKAVLGKRRKRTKDLELQVAGKEGAKETLASDTECQSSKGVPPVIEAN